MINKLIHFSLFPNLLYATIKYFSHNLTFPLLIAVFKSEAPIKNKKIYKILKYIII